MRHSTFATHNSIPCKMNITLRNLLLTNINAVIVVEYAQANRYFCVNAMGTYILAKIHELSDKTRKQKRIKEIIKSAFIESNMSIDEYVNMIEEECHKCRSEMNYLQKVNMKEYLIRHFRENCTQRGITAIFYCYTFQSSTYIV